MIIQPTAPPASSPQGPAPSAPAPAFSPQQVANGVPAHAATPASAAPPCGVRLRASLFDALSAAPPSARQQMLLALGPDDDRRLGLLVALACSPDLTLGRGIALAVGPAEGDLDHVLLNDQSDPLRLHAPAGWPGIEALAGMLETRVVTDVLGSTDGRVTAAVQHALSARLADVLVSRRSEMDAHWAAVAARHD